MHDRIHTIETIHSKNTPPSLLSLPPVVRCQIYRDAGLICDSDVDFNGRLNAGSWPPSATPSTDFQISYNLLLTCRTVYTEASCILYSTNTFFIRYNDARSLEMLRNLTADSIALLTQLTVHLNVASCEKGQVCCKAHPGKSSLCLKHDKPLGTSSPAIISEWQNTARYILARIEPFRLRMYFVCDVDGLETAKYLVEPFRSTPTLADCSIRLSEQPDPLLQDLAQEVATQAMGYQHRSSLSQTQSAFRFLDLPRELRLQILEYTDLVTPLCEVEWNPESNFYLHYYRTGCGGSFEGYLDCPVDFHRACQFRNCWQADPWHVGCFCRRYHAAFSSKCHCWSPPASLFLICKKLREDAQAVFFARNRFIIVPPRGCTSPAESTPARLGISIFLTDIIPSQALPLLRSMEIVFPPFYDDYLRPHETAYQDWLQTIEHVSGLLNLPMLTLRVYMADYILHGEPVADFRKTLTKEQGMTIVKMYARTLRPLSKLRENGLGQFFARLAWPFAHTRFGLRNPTLAREQSAYLRRLIERLVMGDDYDSTVVQTKESGNNDSQWLQEAYADPMSS
ncbi:uncharacterized protein PAC_10137 [Phialocephala subalpina]|uniref:DUF7730 domain-containing protein n=1 Tax=Phialocephala subalpina TaxID=576137 RepID=A0A1L7X5D9_9HELO|nr:uncharacterized protein PAC_10137 [Phialocephala subalpina]